MEQIKLKKKFYQKKWFVVLTVIVIIFILFQIGSGGGIKEYTAEATYETEAIPAKEEVVEDPQTYTTENSGEYIIGQAPKDYASGEEESFTTAENGVYIAGEDFKPGVYDLVPISGSGNVSGTNLNELLSATNDDLFDDLYSTYYDNKNFAVDDVLEVSGVSLELVPQTDDDFFIPPGKYDLKAISGSGNVSGSGVNAILGFENDEYASNLYENAEFKEGKKFETSGVTLDVVGKEPVVVSEATEEIPAGKITETYTLTADSSEPTCTLDTQSVDCKELKNYDSLKEDAEKQKTDDNN